MVGTAIAGRTYAFAPDSINPPTAIVLPSPSEFVTYDRTMDAAGCDDFELVVKVIMGAADERSGQKELMSYFARSGASLLAAIHADPTLGGVVAFSEPTRGTAYGDVEWSGVVYFGAELSVSCST